MAERDLTQQNLIQELNMGSHTISKLYNNSFKRIDRDTVEKLLTYFQCPLEGREGLFVIEELEDDSWWNSRLSLTDGVSLTEKLCGI